MNDVIYKLVKDIELLVIPTSLEYDIIKEAHHQGHFAVKKTVDLIEKTYYIPKIEEKVKSFIHSCIECILAGRKKGKAEGFLNILKKESL